MVAYLTSWIHRRQGESQIIQRPGVSGNGQAGASLPFVVSQGSPEVLDFRGHRLEEMFMGWGRA